MESDSQERTFYTGETMPFLNRYNLTNEIIAHGRASGGLVLSSDLRSKDSIEEEAMRLSKNGEPAYDRVLDMVSGAMAVTHRADIPYIMQDVIAKGEKTNFSLAAQPFDLFRNPTVEGFSFIRILRRHESTGHVSEFQLHTLDMLQARDLGIGGHRPVQEYHQRLLLLPKLANTRSPAQQKEWEIVWSQVRHAFYLALTAELSEHPHLESDEEKYFDQQGHINFIRLRAVCSGELRDASGNIVEVDNEGCSADDFDGMEWPRTYESADWPYIGQDTATSPLIDLTTQSEFSNVHPADVMWCGLLAGMDALQRRENAERICNGQAPLQYARVWVDDESYLIGSIDGPLFHPMDSVFNGTSHYDLTGSPPPYRDISMEEIEEKEFKLEYLPNK